MNQNLKIFPDLQSLSVSAAEKFVELADRAIGERGRFSVALSGGSTPKALHRLLAGDDFKDRVDWEKVFFFFGDERNVSPDHPESNFRMARETLFEPLKIGRDRIFRWETILDAPAEVAADYRESLDFYFRGFPVFDLILLGLGADAHTASLFPGTAALGETALTAVENRVEKLDAWRLTLTFPVINRARSVVFLVAGEEKADALRAVLEGAREPESFPAQSVRPADGELLWLVDEKAAQQLSRV